MKKIYLSSVGFIILSIVMTVLMLVLTILIIFYADYFNFLAILFSILVLLVCGFSLFLSFYHTIILEKDVILIRDLKKRTIRISEIDDIYMVDDIIFQNIIFFKTKTELIKISGCSTLLGKKFNEKSSRKIVEFIKLYIAD